MEEDMNYMYLQSMKDTLVLACGENWYKNGAFATAVTTTTSIIDDLNIIIKSPLLTAYERKVFEQVKNTVIGVRNMEARGEKLDALRFLTDTHEPTMAIEKVISADMKSRGQYSPPWMIQIPGENGTIKKTTLIDDDGNETHYEGGEPGVVPGAPKAFNEAQRRANRNSFRPKEKGDGDQQARGDMRFEKVDTNSKQKTEVSGSTSKPDGASVGPSAEKVKKDLPKPNKSTSFAGFGKAFEGNLKNAFL